MRMESMAGGQPETAALTTASPTNPLAMEDALGVKVVVFAVGFPNVPPPGATCHVNEGALVRVADRLTTVPAQMV